VDIINNKKGIALITVYIIIAVLAAFISSYYMYSLNEYKIAQRQRDMMKAYYAAEAGIAEVAIDLYQLFQPQAYTAWEQGSYAGGFKSIADGYAFPTNVAGPDGVTYSVMQAGTKVNPLTLPIDDTGNPLGSSMNYGAIIAPDNNSVLLRLIAVGTAPHLGGTVRKAIPVTLVYEMGPSPIFNYAYFINNFGWLWGGGIRVNGDVRSNGNFSFNGNPTINGDIYAAQNPALGAAGTITGNSMNKTIAQYHSQVSGRARPTDPSDPADPLTLVEGGYDGTSTRYEQQSVLNMPYLGNLSAYKNLAASNNGSIRQGGVPIVTEVYTPGLDPGPDGILGTGDDITSGEGPDGIYGTPDDGSLILDGTSTPIEISGPVVVEGDVIIKGEVSGQGTIYAGRNIHIIGDITYNNEPDWPKPDADPGATAQTNIAKDFVGLACKGNVVLGNYTKQSWRSNVLNYLQPPFTQSYETDSSDFSLGYDSDGDPTNGYVFDGDYTAEDGGLKNDGTNRLYYESSFSDAEIQAAKPENNIKQVDAIIYNNHACTGKVGSFDINGSIVSRDEAIIYSGSIDMNYDVRAFGEGIEHIDIYLPRDLVMPRVKVRENA